MYGRAIRFAIVQQSTVRLHPSFFLSSSITTQSKHKNRNLVDEIRESASGLPPVSPSGATDPRVNVVKTSTTPLPSSDGVSPPSSSTTRGMDSNSRGREKDGEDTGSYVADTVKQGVVKAMETGLDIGEMAKTTLDNVWDVTKDTTRKAKEAVAGDERKYDVPPSDHFVDDLRKRADGYDRRRNN